MVPASPQALSATRQNVANSRIRITGWPLWGHEYVEAAAPEEQRPRREQPDSQDGRRLLLLVRAFVLGLLRPRQAHLRRDRGVINRLIPLHTCQQFAFDAHFLEYAPQHSLQL